MNLYEFGKLIIQARDGLSVLEFEDEGFVPPQGEALFLDTLNSTGQLSLALESLIMGIMSSHYAQHLNYFDRSAKATIGYFKPYSVPQQYTGLGIVLGIIALHLVLVISILVSFLRSRTFKHWDEDEIRDLGRKHQRDVDGREKPRLLYAQVNSEY